MKLTKDTRILIVGLGLLGGSYARALSEKGYRVTALARRQEVIDYALKENMICEGAIDISPRLIGEADLIVFALYPRAFFEWVEENGHLITPGTLVTDVTGVKEEVIHRVCAHLPRGVEFVACHPMAGKEVGGVENSDPAIFRGANYIVVPTPTSTPEGIQAIKDLGKELGFHRVVELDSADHDEVVGFVSQLTHCIAVCLMTAAKREGLESYTGDSFRDLTRIARINDGMWSELFLLNRKTLLEQIDLFSLELEKLRTYLEEGDREGMREMMRTSTARRALFDKPKA